MELDIDVNGQHLIHEGKLPEAQEFVFQGKERIYETPHLHLKTEQLLERLLKVQDRTLRPIPLPGINTTPAALVYKAGLSLWGIQVVSGEGLYGGFALFNAGAAVVNVFLFDGYDASGTPLLTKTLSPLVDKEFYPPVPIKLDSGLFVGFSGASLDVAKTLGTFYMVRE